MPIYNIVCAEPLPWRSMIADIWVGNGIVGSTHANEHLLLIGANPYSSDWSENWQTIYSYTMQTIAGPWSAGVAIGLGRLSSETRDLTEYDLGLSCIRHMTRECRVLRHLQSSRHN